MRPKITALTLTYNNQSTIEKHIKSLHFADEIIIIDAYSEDATVKFASEKGAVVIQRAFDNFSAQRKFAIQQASHDWIVFFEIEENISKAIAEEIISILSDSNNIHNAFKVNRNFIFQNKKIKYGAWYDRDVVRVFNKKNNIYDGKLIHERLQTNGSVGVLKNQIDYNRYETFDAYNQKLNLDSQLEAKELYDQKKKPSFYDFIVRPCSYFFYHYFIRGGFIDKKEGYILAYIHSFSVFKRYLQLWMMYRKLE
ncbi:glycosyltransferase family 2 protein [Flavobacterium faecale]|uniref:glycosyltransferase family 2 protein n=1 Tax=Flavobacterium faecale TaxID=1355330 RepID=UPI003AADB3E1